MDLAVQEGFEGGGEAFFRWRGAGGGELVVWSPPWGQGTLWDMCAGALDIPARRALSKALREASENGGATFWGGTLTAPSAGILEKLLSWCEGEGIRPAFATLGAVVGGGMPGPVHPRAGEIPPDWSLLEPLYPGLIPLGGQTVRTLGDAERFAALAHLLAGFPLPVDRLREVWLEALEAMSPGYGGTGGEESDVRRERTLRAALWWAEGLTRSATREVAERVGLMAEFPLALPIVVFNPGSWTRSDVVTAHVSFYGQESPAEIPFSMYKVVDADGRSVPFQDRQTLPVESCIGSGFNGPDAEHSPLG